MTTSESRPEGPSRSAGQTPSSSPYFGFLLPFLSALLGGLLCVLIGLLIATRTEWIRRAARWGPYGKELWAEQYALLRDMVTETHYVVSSLEAAQQAETPLGADATRELADEVRRRRANLGRMLAKAHLLADADTMTAATAVLHALSLDTPAETLDRKYWLLVESARRSLGLEKLKPASGDDSYLFD